ACLRLDELEALQQPCGQAGMSADGRPLLAVELPRLPQHGCVDRDLAEVVQPSGPAEAVDVREGEPERTRELVDVPGDAEGVPVGRRIALVDDVGERLERAE